MANKERVCLTTYIYGVRYQAYIPFLVYSCHKSYPEYDIRLYLHDNLDTDIKRQLEMIDIHNVTIIECHFGDCPHITPLKAKSLRWVLWDEKFLEYDYLYIVDIDMIYIREPIPLHEQHVIHMNTTGLPYDNLVRHFTRLPFKLINVLYRIKMAGFIAFPKYLFGSRMDKRVTGLHFINVKDYFQVMNYDICEKYKKMIYNGRFVKMCLSTNNESFLYEILAQVGLQPNMLPIQTDSCKMLDYNCPERQEFRPHHGIHLGIFRQDLKSKGKRDLILDSDVYSFYMEKYKREYLTDPLFVRLVESSPDGIKCQLDNLNRYYGVTVFS